jgi:hypothetical protein
MHGRFSNPFRQKALAPTYQHTKGLFQVPDANLASLYSDPPRPGRLKTAGPAFIGAKFAINTGFWPLLPSDVMQYRVGAAEGCDLLILIFKEPKSKDRSLRQLLQ